MIGETRKAGAEFSDERVDIVLGRIKLSDVSIANKELAKIYEKPNACTLHKSLNGIWWLLELFPHQYYDKDDAEVKTRIPFGAYRKIPAGALIHPTVLKRFETHPCYKPKNIDKEDLLPALPSEGTDATGKTYLKFAPKSCGSNASIKPTWAVFSVTVLELALAVFALYWLIRESPHALHWVSHNRALHRIGTGLWLGARDIFYWIFPRRARPSVVLLHVAVAAAVYLAADKAIRAVLRARE